MNRRVLSLMIPALLVAGSASAAEIYNKDGNKLDLYGKVDGLHYFSDNDGSDGDQSYLRFGFKGETQVTDQLTGYGQWEYQAALNTAESEGTKDSYTRVGFAGLRFGDAGSFDYGRNYGIAYDIGAWTDVLPEFGGDTYGADNFMFQRGNGMATYRNNNFFGLVDGLRFALQYQGKNDADSANSRGSAADTSTQNGDGYGASLGYTIGDSGVSLMSAITSSDRTSQQQQAGLLGRGDKAESWGAGIKYDANALYLASIYTETRNMTPIGTRGFANKAQNIEMVAQYQFDSGLRPSLGYVQTKGKDIEGVGDEDLVKYVDLGLTYYFNKNMSTMVDYKINQLDDNNKLGLNNDDVVAVALTYQF